MKINEFKIQDDELYNDSDIDAVIKQEVSGNWEYHDIDQYIEYLKRMASGGTNESTP